MATYEAIQVLRDLMLDDTILDPAQIKAIRMAIAALDDIYRREQKDLAAIHRWNAQWSEKPVSISQYCEHGGYRSLCPECSGLA